MRQQLGRSVTFAAFIAALSLAGSAYAQCSVPYQLNNGQVADATQVMGDMNALADCVDDGAPAGAANSVQVNGGGTLAGVGPLTDGQLLIGSNGNAPQASTLTAGPGVTITNGPASITISSQGGPAGPSGTVQVNNAGSFAGLQLSDGMIITGVGASFSATAKSPNLTLSDGNLVATSTNASYAAVLGSNSQSSGKFYFEFQNVRITDSNSGIGLGTAGTNFASYLGSNAQSVGLEPNGGVWFNGHQIGTASAVPVGATVSIALDVTNKLIWFQTNSGLWNNSSAANPATGVGGFSVSGIGSSVLYPAAIWREALGTTQIAMTSASWISVAPSGFGPWAPPSTPTAVNVSGAATLSNDGTLTSNARAAQSTPNNPTGTTSVGTQTMQGLAGSVTPGASGRILFMASGDGFNTAAVGQGFIVQLRYGTGTAPANGSAAAGTPIGGAIKGVTAVVSSAQQIPFAVQALVPNLTPGTAYWFDLGLAAIGGGTAAIENVSLTAVEM
ncbi:hypothetical protein [Rhizobium sp. BK376]|uniref:hypothetical protein n=1 Tax=Rhizobium sp. BK376 TaxID=2512149 RepID=UPI0010472A0B|nr:hypothetical protein [Rhizobium sp. BK376]TCR67890.1 hypothetical protein EV561_1475 [Rhizobium sp. BK376]